EGADRFFFIMSPVTALIIGAALLGLIPFAPGVQIANVDVGLPAFLAILTLSPTLVLLAGWSANSKFPFIGGLRALFQQTAYEIPLWLSALGVVIIPRRILGTCDHSSDSLVFPKDNRDHSCGHALQVNISPRSSGPIVAARMDNSPNAFNRQYRNRVFDRRWSTFDLTTYDRPNFS